MNITQDKADSADSSNSIDLLKIALGETQQSIRSYDTKAQICAIGYLFSLNLVLAINESIFPGKGADIWVVIFGWGVLIFPMFLFGFVLYPTRKSVKPDNSYEEDPIYKVLYIRHERHSTVDEIVHDARRANLLEEIAFELYQSSDLRDRKRVRFVRSLIAAGTALLVMFIIHLGAVMVRSSI